MGMTKLFRNVGELLAVAACLLLASSHVLAQSGGGGRNCTGDTVYTTWTRPMRYPLQYMYVDLGVGSTWEEAQSACQAVGGSLATPRNPQEEGFIASAAGCMNRTLYIGVQSVNGMTWTDTNGVPVQFLPWTSRPVMAELCTVIDTASTGPAAWRTVNCSSSNLASFVCQQAAPIACNAASAPCQYLEFTSGWQNVSMMRPGLRQLSSLGENRAESIYFTLHSDHTTMANTTYVYSLPCSLSINLRQSATPANACQPINPPLVSGFNLTNSTCASLFMLNGVVTEQLARPSSDVPDGSGDSDDEDRVSVFNISTLANQNIITVVNATVQCSIGLEALFPFQLNYQCSGLSTNYTFLCPDEESECFVPVQCSNVSFCQTNGTRSNSTSVFFYCPTTGVNYTAACTAWGAVLPAGNRFTCNNETAPPMLPTCDNALPELVTNTGTVTRINVSHANITCNDQYTCLGQQSIIVSCQEFSANCCAPITCPDLPTLTNGTYTPGNYPRQIGSKVDVKCAKGYKLDYHTGSDALPVLSSITVTCGVKGGWSHGSLRCLAVNCGLPPNALFNPINGEQSPVISGMTGTAFNDTFTYTCTTGYSLVQYSTGSLTLISSITISCHLNGQWSGGTPVCARYCGDPGAVNTASTNVLQQNGYTAGGNVSYMCKTGYQTMNGSDGLTDLTCMADGNWTGIPPICINAPTTTVPATTQLPSTNPTTVPPSTRTMTTPAQTLVMVSSAQNTASTTMSTSAPAATTPAATTSAASTAATTTGAATTSAPTTTATVPITAATTSAAASNPTTVVVPPTTDAATTPLPASSPATPVSPTGSSAQQPSATQMAGTGTGTGTGNTATASSTTTTTSIPPATAGAASSDDTLVIGVGAGVGGAVLIVLIIVIIAIAWKRSGRKNSNSGTIPGYNDTTPNNMKSRLSTRTREGRDQVVLSNYSVSRDGVEGADTGESTYDSLARAPLESTFTTDGNSSKPSGSSDDNNYDRLDRTATNAILAKRSVSQGKKQSKDTRYEYIAPGSKPQVAADPKRVSTASNEAGATSTFQPSSDQYTTVDVAKKTPRAAKGDDSVEDYEQVRPQAPVKTSDTSILISSGLSQQPGASSNYAEVEFVKPGSGSTSQIPPEKKQDTVYSDVVLP